MNTLLFTFDFNIAALCNLYYFACCKSKIIMRNKSLPVLALPNKEGVIYGTTTIGQNELRYKESGVLLPKDVLHRLVLVELFKNFVKQIESQYFLKQSKDSIL